jgi:hypothetical protein
MSSDHFGSNSDPSIYGSKFSPYKDQTSFDKIYHKKGPSARTREGEILAHDALVYGVVGIFTFGLLLGPWAIVKALKAKRCRVNATPGFIAGILAIGANISILSYLGFLFSTVWLS